MTSSDEESREHRSIAGRAGVVAAGTLFSRLLGLGRDLVLAAFFSRVATDAWMIAWQIPNMLRQLLAEGAVQTAVLPVLAQVRASRGDAEARRFFRAIQGLSLLVLIVVSLLGVLFAEQVVGLFAAGFKDRPDQFQLTTELTRWVFPYILFMGTAALGVAALNSYQRFVVSSFAPALLNVSFILFALLLPGWLGARGQPRIIAMAVGALVGGALQVAAQWPSLRKIGFLELPTFAFRDPAVRDCLKRLGPGLVGIGVYYVDVIIGRRLLSELQPGAVTYFSYALRLCDLSQGIFIMALSSATLPSLSRYVAEGRLGEVGRTFAFSLRHALFVGLAATGLFVALAEPIVSLLFERGEFGRLATRETGDALMAQGIAIFLVAGVRQLVIVYFALGDTRTPVVVAAIDVVVFAGTAYALRAELGHVGVGLGVSAARVVQFGLLYAGLGRKLADLPHGTILSSGLRSLAASALASGLSLLAARGVSEMTAELPLAQLFPGVVGVAVFGATFLIVARRLGCRELETISQPLLRRLGR